MPNSSGDFRSAHHAVASVEEQVRMARRTDDRINRQADAQGREEIKRVAPEREHESVRCAFMALMRSPSVTSPSTDCPNRKSTPSARVRAHSVVVKRWQSPVSSLGRRRPPATRSRACPRRGSTAARRSASSTPLLVLNYPPRPVASSGDIFSSSRLCCRSTPFVRTISYRSPRKDLK